MVKCTVCSKEKELSEMATDIKWIREKIDAHNHLQDKIALNTDFRHSFMGSIAVWKIILSFVGLVGLGNILMNLHLIGVF